MSRRRDEDDEELDDPVMDNLLDDIIDAGRLGEEIELVLELPDAGESEEEVEEEAVEETPPPAKRGRKPQAVVEPSPPPVKRKPGRPPKVKPESATDGKKQTVKPSPPEPPKKAAVKPSREGKPQPPAEKAFRVTRPYIAGVVLARIGLDVPVAGSTTERADALYQKQAGGKANPREMFSLLQRGQKLVRGYLDETAKRRADEA